MQTLHALVNWIDALLRTMAFCVRRMDAWLRWVIVFLFGWPLVMAAIAIWGNSDQTAFAAFGPVVLGIGLTLYRPTISAALLIIGWTRRNVVFWLGTVLLAEVSIGLYLAWVPVRNDPRLMLHLGLVFVAIAMAMGARRTKVTKTVLFVLGGAVLFITGLFFLGGRETALAETKEAFLKISSPAAGVGDLFNGRSASEKKAGLDGTPTVTVAAEWQKEVLARGSCFAIAPNRNIRVRKDNGEEFQWDAQGNIRPIENGKPGSVIPDIGEYIPNSRLYLKSEDGKPVNVDFQVWPRPDGKTCT